MENRFYMPSVKRITKKIDQLEDDIILMGKEGYGKTTIISEYEKHDEWDQIVVNGSVKPEEMILIIDGEVNNLYHVALLVSKMITKINGSYKEVSDRFFNLEVKINGILRIINKMYIFGNYSSKYNKLDKRLCECPETLIEEFLDLSLKHVGMQNVTIMLDNFDVIGYGDVPNLHYQKYMYNLLKDYTRLIITVSDERILNSTEEKTRLSNDNSLIEVNYSKKINDVKEIIDVNLSMGRHKSERIGLLLSNETIMLMIEKTNGNLFDVLKTIREFYRNINNLNKEEYDAFVLNYIDNVINRSPIFTGHIKRERRLAI